MLVGAFAFLATAVRFKWISLKDLYRRFFPKPPEPEPQPAPIIIEPEIVEVEVPPLPPNYGNIRPKLGEEVDPIEFGPEIHEFPEHLPPATRYEDFNRRLFFWEVGNASSHSVLTETTLDDFPTRLPPMTDANLRTLIQEQLRPRYPVILDHFGWWGAASIQLEMQPDYTDAIVEAYLAIPEAERPVVITRSPFAKDGPLTFFRYGFEPWSIDRTPFSIYPKELLTYLLAGLRGSREDWLWMSIARMRHAVIHDAKRVQAEEEERKFLESEIKRVEIEAKHGGNAWRTLWGLRPQMPGTMLPDNVAEETASREVTAKPATAPADTSKAKETSA